MTPGAGSGKLRRRHSDMAPQRHGDPVVGVSEIEGEVIADLPGVQVREEESFENALRRFKRKCEKSGVLTELKRRQHFEKPSVKRKRKAIQARKKILRKMAEERRLGLR